MTIADRIRNKRLELGWNQEDLAKRMGYKDKTSVSKLESSGDNISLKKISRAAEALNADVAEFLGVYERETVPDHIKRYIQILDNNKIKELMLESLTDFELSLIDAYRDVSDDTKNAICAILGLQKED